MNTFRTEVVVPQSSFSINYKSEILSLGSCFAQHMGDRLSRLRFSICNNPFGMVYNPASLAGSLDSLLAKREFTHQELFQANGLWHSFSHHSSFSDMNAEKCLSRINFTMEEAIRKLESADLLILTLGTAWVYEDAETGSVVNNCHKLPAARFRRHRLSVHEVVATLSDRIELLEAQNPDLKVVLTVSPIRHWKDGPVENQLSKSTLLLATSQLVGQFDQVEYFPSYEIVMDELRDYRFYASDMTHLNETALSHIWGKFAGGYFSDKTRSVVKKVEKVARGLEHRPYNPETQEHKTFLRGLLSQIQELLTTHQIDELRRDHEMLEEQLRD